MQDENENQNQTTDAPEGEQLPQEDTDQNAQSQENNGDAEPKSGEGAGDGDAPKEHKEKKQGGWVQIRIDDLTAKRYKAEREAEQLKEQNQALLEQLASRQNGDDSSPEAPKASKAPTSRDEIERLAEEKAKVIAANQVAESQYKDSLDTIWNNGVKEFNDFGQAVDNLNNLQELFSRSLPIIIHLNSPHKVLHHLSNDLDEAARVFSLPPEKRAIELTRIETSLGKSKPVSGAPSPLRPVEGKGKSSFDPNDPNVDTKEWIKWREKELEKSRGAR